MALKFGLVVGTIVIVLLSSTLYSLFFEDEPLLRKRSKYKKRH